MAIKTRKELEQELEDIKSRISVIETAQKHPKNDKPKDETEVEKPKDETEVEKPKDETEVETEDEIEKLLNS